MSQITVLNKIVSFYKFNDDYICITDKLVIKTLKEQMI